MKCQSKFKEMGAVFFCTDEAVEKIVITTLVPHLNNQKMVRTRCFCSEHAKRYRGKLNHHINILHKSKSYTTTSI